MASTTIQAALKAQKRTLRRNISAQLNEISQQSLEEQSHLIAQRVLSLSAFQRCHSISCYLSMPAGEVRTGEVVDAILNSGKSLFVPKIQTTDGTMDFLRVYSTSDLASLPSGTWGIKEPDDVWEGRDRSRVLGSGSSSSEPVDIILLPGVAFDRSLSRLGHGKGYYDRFITAYASAASSPSPSQSVRPKPLLVGLALREQLLENGQQVPMAEHDWKMDVLIMPDETISRNVDAQVE